MTTNMYVLIKMVRMFIAFKADSSIATTEKTAVILLKRSPSDGSNLVQCMMTGVLLRRAFTSQETGFLCSRSFATRSAFRSSGSLQSA